ncbi:hypothetical protein C8R45DRAFT_1165679 [Mycena sanguinolenta]|nr:hypothetical protein C8R45DRAFT_1165679 [Mycena sanguinolenta]
MAFDLCKKIISAILDSEDVPCCTATGDDKSAAFTVPILVLNEYNTHKDLYPVDFPTRSNSRRNGRSACGCVSSRNKTRRQDQDFYEMECYLCRPGAPEVEGVARNPDFPEFRSQLTYAATDEAHLINEWGQDLRVDFKSIGLFICGHLPPSISVIAFSATLAPGKDTTAFYLDMSFLIFSPTCTVAAESSISIHCYAWIWRMQPDYADKKRHTLLPSKWRRQRRAGNRKVRR